MKGLCTYACAALASTSASAEGESEGGQGGNRKTTIGKRRVRTLLQCAEVAAGVGRFRDSLVRRSRASAWTSSFLKISITLVTSSAAAIKWIVARTRVGRVAHAQLA